MNVQGLQKAKYLRQLRVMRHELEQWEAAYRAAAISTTADHLKGRFAARMVVLADVRATLTRAIDQMYELPRLS